MHVGARLRRWLTGSESDPSVRARFWTEVEGRPRTDPRVRTALREIGKTGWAADLLSYQQRDGHWVTPGSSGRELYRPKYIVTNWLAIVLADLGMTRTDPRIRRTAELILDRWSQRGGDLTGRSGEICVTGNAVRTLTRFGYLDHPAVQRSIGWIVRTQKADGGWHCFRSRTGTLDGWEGLAALAEIPEPERSPAVGRSIERGAEFYLRRRLMREGRGRYPPWYRIHYPHHYYYDLLVGLRVLTRLGYGADRRLGPALRWLASKRAPDGSWSLDASHPDLDPAKAGYSLRGVVFPMQLEPLYLPSRWATVEALAVLARSGAA
ncbi:MAG TPA: prenyltransferase/squalene oxidase repeat-containing protein [Thermoplasmata archaeon]|nr:prenyltransferase/squalene oxidase repeat-containing protein [Thermoplasmata archaeon]